MSEMLKVAETKDVPPGTAIAVDVSGQKVALFNADGTYYAIDDTCTHAGGPLSEGDVNGTEVTCPWHGANFDVCTGKNLSPPAPQEVACYEVRVDGEDIQVEIP